MNLEKQNTSITNEISGWRADYKDSTITINSWSGTSAILKFNSKEDMENFYPKIKIA